MAASRMTGLIGGGRKSPAQKEVMVLYRSFFRLIERKSDDADASAVLKQKVRATFRERAKWPRQDTETIEAWLKMGWRRLKVLEAADSLGTIEGQASIR